MTQETVENSTYSDEKYNQLLDAWLKGIRTNKQKLIDAYEEKRKE